MDIFSKKLGTSAIGLGLVFASANASIPSSPWQKHCEFKVLKLIDGDGTHKIRLL